MVEAFDALVAAKGAFHGLPGRFRAGVIDDHDPVHEFESASDDVYDRRSRPERRDDAYHHMLGFRFSGDFR
jgi:hypothetical protein